jgi:hypothetical protein
MRGVVRDEIAGYAIHKYLQQYCGIISLSLVAYRSDQTIADYAGDEY